MKRRTFLEKTTLGTATALIPTFYLPSFARNTKLKVGLIGCGWYGMVITKAALKVGGVEVIGICDVDDNHLQESATELEQLQGNRPKTYKDYEALINQSGLEAVFIGTPPHWHALQFLAACRKGLHIYCEKPLAYDVREGQAMVEAAQQSGNIVQIGFQRRQSQAFQKAKALIDEGVIGKIHRVSAQIHYNPNLSDHTVQPPPPTLDWEAWCGPAPLLDYRPSIGHKAWRLEKQYGNGHLVDWGIHHIDIIRHILGLGMPNSLETTGGIYVHQGKITTPDTLDAKMHFDQCPVMWQHRLWGSGSLHKDFNNGVFFYGEKATLFARDHRLVLLKAGKKEEQEVMNIRTDDIREKHMANFLNAVKNRDKNSLSCPIEDAFQSTATVQLAMASHYSNSVVVWNPAKGTIDKNKKASALLSRPYRSSYRRPKV